MPLEPDRERVFSGRALEPAELRTRCWGDNTSKAQIMYELNEVENKTVDLAKIPKRANRNKL